jgi:formylglycine-generating enzyme required for sulfatase activity
MASTLLLSLVLACGTGAAPPPPAPPVAPAAPPPAGPSGGAPLSQALALVPVGALEVGALEVSNALFRRFDAEHTSNRYQRGDRTRALDFDAPGQPAIVTWNEAQAFCAWASAGLGRTVRLPTDAEWVAFAGDIPPPSELHRFANGADPATFAAVVAGDAAYPQDDRLPGDDGFVGTAPVGRLLPNPSGLHDVWGNVTEWTSTPHGDQDVLHRGGAWNNGPAIMGGPNHCGRNQHYDSTGFRVVVEPAG